MILGERKEFMPILSSFYGIVIYMYFKDHNPLHIHASCGEINAILKIGGLSIMDGFLPPNASRMDMSSQSRVNQYVRNSKVHKD